MFIEALSICKNYSDYLTWALLFNRQHFDNYLVVTSHDDWETQNVCRFYNVRYITTNLMDENFNKGKCINLGLSHLKRTGFIAHLDSDIILPPRTRQMLEYAKLQHDTLYSFLRMNVVGFDKWVNFITKPALQHENEIYIHPNAFPLGAIVSKTWNDVDFAFDKGYCPIGYAQIWSEADGVRRVYSEEHDSCARSDMIFSLQWPREKRQLIPEIISYHLMTPDGVKQGINWENRKTQKFCLDEYMKAAQ